MEKKISNLKYDAKIRREEKARKREHSYQKWAIKLIEKKIAQVENNPKLIQDRMLKLVEDNPHRKKWSIEFWSEPYFGKYGWFYFGPLIRKRCEYLNNILKNHKEFEHNLSNILDYKVSLKMSPYYYIGAIKLCWK